MSENTPTSELIDRLFKQSGIKKKLATEILHAIPEIIEEGLKRDGEVRVKGLGTFRMKWTQARPGRNPKTGESVEIPPHNRLVFLPEQSLKEYINRDNRLLGYKVIAGSEDRIQNTEYRIQNTEVRSQKSEDRPDSDLVSVLEKEQEPLSADEIDYEYEPEVPVRKRRIHWIIPAAVSVIILLSLVFYFRNFIEKNTEDRIQNTEYRPQNTEDRSQKTEGGQQLADSSQQLADSSQQSTVGSWQLADSIQQSAVGGQRSADTGQTAKLITQNSQLQLKTQDSRLKTISEGQHLFKLAREVYGNPFLWVLIYKANQDMIPDPDEAISGKEINIPVLEGTPDRLSRNDSLEVAEGYRLVYEFYKTKDDPRAADFNKAYHRFLNH